MKEENELLFVNNEIDDKVGEKSPSAASDAVVAARPFTSINSGWNRTGLDLFRSSNRNADISVGQMSPELLVLPYAAAPVLQDNYIDDNDFNNGTEYTHGNTNVVSSAEPKSSKTFQIILSIFGWYLFSSILMVFNKYVLGANYLDFSYPLFMSSTNMFTHALLSDLLVSLTVSRWEDNREDEVGDLEDANADDVVDDVADLAARRREKSREEWIQFFRGIVPCAFASGLDIGLSNASLKFITLSFYTMVKSSSPIFVLLFAFAFRLEKPRINLILIIGVIALGTLLTVANEPQFEPTGFLLIMCATVMSGLRWSLTQILLKSEKSQMHSNPLQVMRRMSPVTAILVLIVSFLAEQGLDIFRDSGFFQSFSSSMKTFGLIGISGFVSFFMILCEFHLINLTSVVTLSVTGIFKELLLIFVGSVLYKDTLTVMNIFGFCVTLIGIILYNHWKWRERRGRLNNRYEGEFQELVEPMSGNNPTDIPMRRMPASGSSSGTRSKSQSPDRNKRHHQN